MGCDRCGMLLLVAACGVSDVLLPSLPRLSTCQPVPVAVPLSQFQLGDYFQSLAWVIRLTTAPLISERESCEGSVLRATGQNLVRAGCVAYAAAACLNGQQIQATVDLAAPFSPLISRLLGPGVATCPVSSAVVPTTTNTGRGEWLYPTGAGRESDLLPPLPTARGKLILYLHGKARAHDAFVVPTNQLT